MTAKTKEKKPKSKLRKILSWVITSVFGVLLVGIFSIQIMGMVTAKENNGVPSYFGHSVLVIKTDSMAQRYPVKSAVFVEKVEKEDMKNLKVGDDVTFLYPLGNQKVPYTHELIDISVDANGVYHFTAHGINKNSNQCSGDCTNQTQVFTENELIGKVVGCSVFVGGLLTFLTSWWGLLIVLLIPSLYLIISSVIDIFKTLKDEGDESGDDHHDSSPGGSNPQELSEEDKKRLKEQLLEEMLEKRKVTSK